MSKQIKGNHKHLTQDDRIYIEKSLDLKMPFREIAKYLMKDPTTISKEVRGNADKCFAKDVPCAMKGVWSLKLSDAS
ncbi:hypothetical protein SDC9_131452 [bioreactor metagenome]|uniref:Transposase IS30-like HTH domain-containing protein n=1 Tax=bioreactor metagenome TaxID=1076179 RepID=A0A645D579_9ZZZZ